MRKKNIIKQRHYKELYGILFLALGIFFALCLISYNPTDPAFNSASNVEQISNFGGKIGAYLADILFTILGISAYVLCGALIIMSIMQFMGKTIKIKWSDAMAYTILIISAATILHLRFEVVEIRGHPIGGGGLIGSLLGVVLQQYLNKPGAYIASFSFFIITFLTPALHPLTRLFPLFVLALALPIGIIETLSVVNQKLTDFLSGTELVGKKSIEEKEAEVEFSTEARALGWMMSYVVLFFLIGPLLAWVIAPLVLMRYIGKMKWLTSAIIMSITWVVVYLVFVVLVGATLPKGLIFGSIW